MCGGHRANRIFVNLVDDSTGKYSRYVGRSDYRRDSQGEIEQEVKLMYARGEIESSTYHRLIELAQSGQLSWDDLNQIEKKPQVAVDQERWTVRKRDAEIVGSLNQLYTRRKQLENARQETEGVLRTLEGEATRLAEQAKTAQSKAQQAIGNDDAARSYLQTRQKALGRANAVQEHIGGLRQNLERIKSLEADLSTREAELKALESGEQLAELEANIRQELLSGE